MGKVSRLDVSDVSKLSLQDLDALRQGYKYVFTVFTPTHNRARTLGRGYESLLQQTFCDFEWVIVDDGSTDETASLVKRWISDPCTWFPIRYFWQPNQHKKVAFNRGVREAQGRFFVTLDSDDALLPNTLETFVEGWLSIPEGERDRFAGVCGHCVDENGDLIGKLFPCTQFLDASALDMYYVYRERAEKFGFTRTDILREHPFPEDISGLVPESVVWHRIGARYKTRFINRIVRVYHRDSASVSRPVVLNREMFHQNAEGLFYAAWLRLSENIHYLANDPMEFVKDAARLTRFRLHRRTGRKMRFFPTSLAGKVIVLLCMPLGITWYLVDLSRAYGQRFWRELDG